MTIRSTAAIRNLRSQAEAKLDEAQLATQRSQHSYDESLQLNHELQVHQLELEMQNEELRRTQHELEILQSRYFDLYDLAPVGYLTINDKGLVLEANLAAATMLRVARGLLIQQSINRFMPFDEQLMFNLKRKECFETSSLQTWDMCLLRSDGSSFYAQLRATPAHNGEYWITLADNSVQKKLEIELSRTRTAAEAANRAKSVFLATMSHEIRSPINGIIGLTDILLETELTEKQLGYTKTIKQAGKCLVQLVGNILDLSKIEANKVELEVINFNLQVEMNGMINLLALQAHKKWLELNLQIDDVPLRLRGDAGRLCQIITNLISNAIKFTEAGSVALQVSKEQEDRRQVTLRFVVRDSGIGIEACRLGTIFDPFTQADDSITRKFGGTGLGLTIARQLTELMGGSMGVESVPGKGSTFWLTAVFEKQTSSSEAIDTGYAQDRHRPEISANSAHNGLRILLAEDDHINQLVSASILTKLGYKVDVVPNGTDALRKLSTEDYDLVLMDCMMPGVNGYEATAVIRDKESAVRNHAIPVIALSGNVFVTDQEKCRAAGMDDFLSKPVIILDLVALLEKWSAADRTLHQNTG